jgi:hypothetical protein
MEGGKYPNDRNDNLFIYDGSKILELSREPDDYGTIPDEFGVISEFPPRYWHCTESRGVVHNELVPLPPLSRIFPDLNILQQTLDNEHCDNELFEKETTDEPCWYTSFVVDGERYYLVSSATRRIGFRKKIRRLIETSEATTLEKNKKRNGICGRYVNCAEADGGKYFKHDLRNHILLVESLVGT